MKVIENSSDKLRWNQEIIVEFASRYKVWSTYVPKNKRDEGYGVLPSLNV